MKSKSLAERFNSRYKIDEWSGCWLWTGFINTARRGYGQIGRGCRPSKALPAHRVSWELHKGPIPEGMFVCHKCDVPRCVNPEHLFLGTHDDNMRDMKAKGRNHIQISLKLTRSDVDYLRNIPLEDIERTKDIARVKGMSFAYLRNIQLGHVQKANW